MLAPQTFTLETVFLRVLHGQSRDLYLKNTHIQRIPPSNHKASYLSYCRTIMRLAIDAQ